MNSSSGRIRYRFILVACWALYAFPAFSQALEKRSILNNHVELLMPRNFSRMDSEMVDYKYSMSAYKPSLVWSEASTDITIAVEQQVELLDSGQLEAFKNRQMDIWKKTIPNADWQDQGMKRIQGRKFGYFKVQTNTYQEVTYNYFFFTTLGDHPLIFCISCTQSKYLKWKDTEEAIVNSVTIHE